MQVAAMTSTDFRLTKLNKLTSSNDTQLSDEEVQYVHFYVE